MRTKSVKAASTLTIADQVQTALDWLNAHSSKAILADYAPRYGIHTVQAFGVSMASIKLLAKQLGRNHELALALWDSGWYEARMLSSLVDEPAKVTAAQMDRWCRDFDNWAVCDTLCFNLFDRTPHAWSKVAKWSSAREEFRRRAAFALLASIALHDKKAPDAPFLDALPLIEAATVDGRNFVKKAVSWALRSVGRRNVVLNRAAREFGQRLLESPEIAARWIARDVLKELGSPAVLARIRA